MWYKGENLTTKEFKEKIKEQTAKEILDNIEFLMCGYCKRAVKRDVARKFCEKCLHLWMLKEGIEGELV